MFCFYYFPDKPVYVFGLIHLVAAPIVSQYTILPFIYIYIYIYTYIYIYIYINEMNENFQNTLANLLVVNQLQLEHACLQRLMAYYFKLR